MVYPIVVYGSPILRKVALGIPEDYPDLEVLIADMFETMYVSDGMGLAAPQIGKSLRLFVIDTTPMAEDDPTLDGFKKAFVNPKIIEETGEVWEFTEGCLSLPGLREGIKRKGEIRIRYYDEKFRLYDERYDGVKARVIQHEYDHLEGTLFVDRVSAIKKKMLKGKLSDISKGKTSVAYKTRVMK